MGMDLPIQWHIPDDCAGLNRLGSSWQQFSDATLPMIHQVSWLIHHLEQGHGPIVKGFSLQISSS